MTKFLVEIIRERDKHTHMYTISANSLEDLEQQAKTMAVHEGFLAVDDAYKLRIEGRNDKRPLESRNCSDWFTINEYANYYKIKNPANIRQKILRKTLPAEKRGKAWYLHRDTEYTDNRKKEKSRAASWLTINEYAEINQVNPQNVRQKILRGTLPARKSGSTWYIRADTKYLDKRKKNDAKNLMDKKKLKSILEESRKHQCAIDNFKEHLYGIIQENIEGDIDTISLSGSSLSIKEVICQYIDVGNGNVEEIVEKILKQMN